MSTQLPSIASSDAVVACSLVNQELSQAGSKTYSCPFREHVMCNMFHCPAWPPQVSVHTLTFVLSTLQMQEHLAWF